MVLSHPEHPFRGLVPAHLDHRRSWEDALYVYPVVSRRSGGLSIGLNLNPDKRCNFDCAYCQVDRTTPPRVGSVDLDVLLRELSDLLDQVESGRLWEHPRFASTPAPLRVLRDLAFSGDGEPTTEKRFDEVVLRVASLKRARGLDGVKLVLITDAACLHHARVRRGLAILDENEGEVWAKLDAGTEAYYRAVNRTHVPFDRVLRNLREAASARPIVIQSLFMKVHGEGPPPEEVEAYVRRLEDIERAGTLKEVQVYTLARAPAEPWCGVLPDHDLDDLAARVRARVRAPVRTYYGPGGESE